MTTATEDTVIQSACSFSVVNKPFQETLKPAVEVATKGTTKGAETEYLFTLRAESSEFSVHAFGGKLAVVIEASSLSNSEIDYKCSEDGNFTINAVDVIMALDSFLPEERLNLKVEGNSLLIIPESDPDEMQSIPLNSEQVTVPDFSTKVVEEMSIDRSTLLRGIDKVKWAVGVEEHREQYFYWQLKAQKGEVRFVAGTGGRFSILDIKGSSIVDVSKKSSFLFHKDQTDPIFSILKQINEPSVDQDDMVLIQYSERDGNAPEQISITVDGLRLVLMAIDTTVKYPDMGKFLDASKDYKIKTKLSDWEYPVKGIMATWTNEIKKKFDSHDAYFEPMLDKDYILLTTQTKHKAKRKIPIEDKVVAPDKEVNLKFCCLAPYIREVYTKMGPEGSVEIEYFDDTHKPLVISSQEKDNGNGVTDQHYMLIAPLKK